MKLRERTLEEIAEMICGNGDRVPFVYRSSTKLTRFFRDIDTDYVHTGDTRSFWVTAVLREIMLEPAPNPHTPPETFLRVIRSLMDKVDAVDWDPDRSAALQILNTTLNREGFEAFYGDDDACYLRNTRTNTVATPSPNPHRPLTQAEIEKRDHLAAYLDKCSEDQLIEEILLPLFRQLGFHRITMAGHKDKALEYGKDVWMRYTLPTQHVLYFGIQAKRDKLDSSGMTKAGNANVAEILNQVTMMLGHEIFDPEIGRKVLVDHAFIVAGGEITKAARNWLGSHLDQSKRSQIMFMDRDDILNLYTVTGLPLPEGAIPPAKNLLDTDVPF
ncbi:hypothetical protein AB4099_25580 [Bosea sp. 2KB_26]|uniref:hypothetical protein n=1 Tax=Bosea sp. 2KB_26 TaxID=3237475 RepID=UPI003F938065